MATATKRSKIILNLTEEEADYLCAITQNPMETHESDKTNEIRASIFNSLAGLVDTYHGASS